MRKSERELIGQAIDGLMSDDDYAFDSAMNILCMLVGRRPVFLDPGKPISVLEAATSEPRAFATPKDTPA